MLTDILRNHWGHYKTDLHPKDRRMRVLSDRQVHGMSTENVRYLLNEIVKRFANPGVYLEVGVLNGCSLLSAGLYNPAVRCIGIDNFSEFNKEEDNELRLRENLAKFGNPKNIEWHKGDFRTVMPALFEQNPALKVDVYFYDGGHTYDDQSTGLHVALPHLSKQCIVIVDDINWPQVRQANRDFLRANPDFRSVVRLRTKAANAPDWWNGIEIFARGYGTGNRFVSRCLSFVTAAGWRYSWSAD